jgi:hypothetical protein
MNFILSNRRNRFRKHVEQQVSERKIIETPEVFPIYFLSVIVRFFNDKFMSEFVDYYLSEGVDMIYIVNDNDSTINIPESILNNPKVTIWYSQFNEETQKEYHKNQMYFCNLLYSKVRSNSVWFINIDSDEFINTRKSPNKTIRDELMTTFKNVDCIKIPWIMMASNGLEFDPPSILQALPYRWNHDLRHPNPTENYKSRCWYEYIHCKCIFKGSKFTSFHNHAPYFDTPGLIGVDSVYGNTYDVKFHHYDNLREKDIASSYLICNHYRVISKESCIRKCNENKLPGYNSDFNSVWIADYPEILDEHLKNKSIERFGNLMNM